MRKKKENVEKKNISLFTLKNLVECELKNFVSYLVTPILKARKERKKYMIRSYYYGWCLFECLDQNKKERFTEMILLTEYVRPNLVYF